MAGRHTLAVMPTGAGKSLCYQVPALAREGTALVISPLIALMHDQIRAADAFGIKAACLTSADSNRAETVERLRQGDLDLLYVAPERATGESFRSLIARVKLALIAIDEATASVSGDMIFDPIIGCCGRCSTALRRCRGWR
jgi:ATP-dependent DNA helicase RecQ